jgi:hypothetical protein
MAATKRQKRSSAASPTVPATASQASSQDVTLIGTTSPKVESIAKVKASEAPTLIIERPVEPPQPAPEPVEQPNIPTEPALTSAAREPVEQTDIPAAAAPILTGAAPVQPAQLPNKAEHETQASASARTADSLASERAAMFQRRAATIGGIGALALLIAFLAYRAFAPQPAAPAPALAAPTAAASAPAPTAAAAPTPQPAPTAAAAPVAAVATNPTAVANPTAVPAATLIPQTGGAAASQGLSCNAIAGLPVYAGATCTDQDTDQDDGVLKLKNTYMATAAADEVRRFYEASFGQNGLALGDFTYDINLGQRRVKIEVELDQGPSGAFSKVKLTEQGGPAAAGITCVPIAQLPNLPNATCIKFKTDQDNGVLKTENTYSTSASPEEIRRLYEGALAQNGWIGQEFQYELQQGLRRLQIHIESQPAPQASLTEFKIEEK